MNNLNADFKIEYILVYKPTLNSRSFVSDNDQLLLIVFSKSFPKNLQVAEERSNFRTR